MSQQAVVHIRQYRLTDEAPVQDLFASGLIEFSGDVEHDVRKYVHNSLKQDMGDILAHYLSNPRSNFWVAEFGSQLVGIVGIQPTDKVDEAELRRMSVSSLVRRQGVGRRLLETTENFCREQGYRRIGLSTVDFLKPALAMYRSHGYTTVKEESHGDEAPSPIIVHYLVKELY